jgi:hypothetical protein
MVFACASAQVAVNGSTTMEMMDALNIVSSWFLAASSYNTTMTEWEGEDGLSNNLRRQSC